MHLRISIPKKKDHDNDTEWHGVQTHIKSTKNKGKRKERDDLKWNNSTERNKLDTIGEEAINTKVGIFIKNDGFHTNKKRRNRKEKRRK